MARIGRSLGLAAALGADIAVAGFGGDPGPAPCSLEPGKEARAVVQKQKDKLKGLRVGVGPFIDLQGGSGSLVGGSGYDYYEEIAAELAKTGLFKTVEPAKDASDDRFDFVVSAASRYDRDYLLHPEKGPVEDRNPMGWTFHVRGKDSEVYSCDVQLGLSARDKKNFAREFPLRALLAQGQLLGWKVAELAIKETSP